MGFRLNLKAKFLLAAVFAATVSLSIDDYWLIETLVRYVCASCIGLG